MGTIYKELESVAYGVKWLLEDVRYEGLENRLSYAMDESALEDVCCSINYDWDKLDLEMLEQGMGALNCGDPKELFNLLSGYHKELEGILN